MNFHKLPFVLAVSTLCSVGCTQKQEIATMYFVDWIALGVKAPSVLPETAREKIVFTVTELRKMPGFHSPKVLAPYNVSMVLNTEITGTVDGKPRKIQTLDTLLAGLPNLTAGTRLELEVGKKNPENVYAIRGL